MLRFEKTASDAQIQHPMPQVPGPRRVADSQASASPSTTATPIKAGLT